MNKTIIKYIKNKVIEIVTSCHETTCEPVLKYIKAYCELRLKLLKNETVTKIEHQVVMTAIKAGLKYANTKYGLGLSNTDIDAKVDEYAPEVLKGLHDLRIEVFEKVLFQGKEIEI